MTQGKGVKFLWDNYVDQSILANYYVSSQQAAFPITNAFNFNRRSKVWRSNGYFNITSANNVLIFRDSIGGPDILATVPIGEYNSTSAFMQAVKDAMDDVGGNTYTVLQTTNKKFNLISSGLVFELRGGDPLNTLGPVMGYNTTNVYTGASSYEADLIRIGTSEWILWDTGISSRPNAFAMTGSKVSGLKFSASSVVRLRGSPTNPTTWGTTPVDITIEHDDESMGYITEDNFSDVGYRYWRLDLMDIDNAYGYLEVGSFFLGKWWAPEGNTCAIFPFDVARQDSTETLRSEGGQTFSELLPKYKEYGIGYDRLSKQDCEDLDFWFNKIGTGKPFFVSADTNSQFSTKWQRKLIYGKIGQSPLSTQLYRVNNSSSRIIIREEL